MSLKYILQQAGSKMGLDPATANERSKLLRFANEGARELYVEADLQNSIMEMVFRVNGDQTISLPNYVDKLRGIRELNSQSAWSLNQLRPRYNQFNWKDMWKNWRLKGKQALQNSLINQSVGVITVAAVETPPIIVTVSGPTINSTLIHESITMDAVSKQTTNAFLDYSAVKKDRVSTYDVTLSDIDGNVLTVISNNELTALYQIVDVSLAPWLMSTSDPFSNYMEVLFKAKLNYLSDDSDEFCLGEYDDTVVNKMMQLWKEEQDKTEAAQLYDAKATRSAARINEDQDRATEDVVGLVANPHDTIHRRVGSGNRRRQGYTGYNY